MVVSSATAPLGLRAQEKAAQAVPETRDWHVHPDEGSDENDGSSAAPLATAQAAVDRARPGDRVVLHPEGGIYRQSLVIARGQSDLVIEGNGVTLTGADPLDPEGWENLGDGLHRRLLPRTQLDRHLLVVRGVPQSMGRAQAAPDAPAAYPAAEALAPGEFRWDELDEESGWLTYRGDTSELEWSVRADGFATAGEAQSIRVFHLNAIHFLDDGFHVEDRSRGLQFFHIAAIGNLGDGFSARDRSSCWIQGGRFLGNRNAIADSADTYYTDCLFGDSTETEILLEGGRHSLLRCRILAGENSVPIRIRASSRSEGGDELSLANLVLREVEIDLSKATRPKLEIGPGTTVYYDPSTAPHIEPLETLIEPGSRLSADLYRIHPIGRDASGEPIMAWVAGDSHTPRKANYRIIHLDRHHPDEVTPEVAPNNDWHGLMEPLPTAGFPPEGSAFTPENESAHAIWRWIGLTAPDAVFLPDTPEGRALGAALQKEPPAGVGRVDLFLSREADDGSVHTTLLPPRDDTVRLAKDEMLARLARSPLELLEQMAPHYGVSFDGGYLDGLALMAKMRAGLPHDAPELALAKADSPLPASAGNLSGTLVYAELALRDEEARPWALERLRRVADLAFAEDGTPLPSMPYHGEMSDAVFMSGPLLVLAGALTGEERYFDQAVRHVRFVQAMCLRPDGLYRHSPLHEAAWGRGNGFPALGIAMMLDHFPEEHPERNFLEESLLAHLEALAPYQNTDGLWHQIVDHNDSYAEFTATGMIAYAISRGIRTGRLPEPEWSPRLHLAWNAVKARIDTDGKTIINVCTGTGKQRSLEDYYRRTAIFGRDPRGGGVAMLLAAEMHAGPEPR